MSTAQTASDPLRVFFSSATDDTIVVPHCQDCDQFHWYPMERCPRCTSTRLEWTPISNAGTLYSSTIVRYSFTPVTKDKIPYGIALVIPDEAPTIRIVCHIARADEVGPLTPGRHVRIHIKYEPDFIEAVPVN